MKSPTFIAPALAAPAARKLPLLARLARKLLVRMLGGLKTGQLVLVDGDERRVFGPGGTPAATLTVLDDAFYADAVFGGSIGVAESYMLGNWKADDLTALIRLMVLNREIIDGMDDRGLARLA